MNFESSGAIGKILSGLAKSLNVANQLIPLYKDTKPLFKNVQNIYNSIVNKDEKEDKKKDEVKKDVKTEVKSDKKDQNHGPQFFI